MTTAVFSKKSGKFCGLCVSGHSGYDEQGYDIVCAAVSSAVYLTANNLTEIYGEDADFNVKDGKLSVFMKNPGNDGDKALEGLCIHLCQLSFQYPEHLRVRIVNAR